jgi:hypothetical protein
VHVARVDLADGADGTRPIGGENAGAETVRSAVGLGDGALPVTGGADRHGRAGQLVLAEGRPRVDPGHDGVGEDGVVTLAADQHFHLS